MSEDQTHPALTDRQHHLLTFGLLAIGLVCLAGAEATRPEWYSKIFITVGLFSASVAVWRAFVWTFAEFARVMAKMAPKEDFE